MKGKLWVRPGGLASSKRLGLSLLANTSAARRISPESAVFDQRRLDKLRALMILDSAQEAQFDRLTQLATEVLDVPIALVSLVDDERQFFKCSVGLPEPWASKRETPLSHSFCQHVVDSTEPLILSDARGHEVLRENLAVSELGVVAYAGIPLLTADGFVLGSFCAIDTKPREWTDVDVKILTVFAAATMSAIELHLERDVARSGEIQLEATLEQVQRQQDELVAVQRSDAVAKLAAGVAHDFNNLLQVITSTVELASQELPSNSPAYEILEVAADAATRGAARVQELLVAAGTEVPGFRPTTPSAVEDH